MQIGAKMIKFYDKITYLHIDEIIPYENNARENSKAIAALVKAVESAL